MSTNTNSTIIGHAVSRYAATIPANGTLSGEIPLGNYSSYGLFASNLNGTLNAGTLSFLVSPFSDSDTYGNVSNYVPLVDNAGANITLAMGAQQAYSPTNLNFLSSYQYVKIKSSVTQVNGLSLVLTLKA